MTKTPDPANPDPLDGRWAGSRIGASSHRLSGQGGTSTISAALTSRFEHEAVPLLGQLRRRARDYAANATDAEDLVQDTLAKAWQNFDSFTPGTNLRAWMYRIMLNTWISSYRARLCRPLELLTNSFHDRDMTAASRHFLTLPSAEAQVLKSIPHDGVKDAVQALPEHLQVAIYYAYVRQLSCAETAQIMNIPLGTVLSRLHRARGVLRASLTATVCT